MRAPILAPLGLLAPLALASSPYKPTTTACPAPSTLTNSSSSGGITALIRDSNSALAPAEATYLAARKLLADTALRTWLDTQSPGLGAATATMPTVGLTISGGGWRSMLVGAGTMRAMDAREDGAIAPGATAGLLQALSYHVGVSGGAWLVASWAGADFPTISALMRDLWLDSLDDGLEFPGGWRSLKGYLHIADDVLDKGNGGWPISMTDLWSRLLAYQFLGGANGGVAARMSDIRASSNMTAFRAPIALIDMNGVNTAGGLCNPTANGTVWEATPWEFGSWDDAVSAWIPIEHLGTAAADEQCTVGFDNLGLVLGMSSSLFGYEACVADDPFAAIEGVLDTLKGLMHNWSEDTLFGRVPNPFKGFNGGGDETAEVFAVDELYMVDGGIGLHNNPVAPLLEPARDVGVIFVSDSSADLDNLPTGACLVDARDYVANISRINSRMPTIPDKQVFLDDVLYKSAKFFGCDEPEAVTLVWLPNVNYTYASGTSTNKFQYDADVTEGLIGNGAAVMTQQDDEGWGLCLACAVVMKEEGVVLPEGCDACFERYCYREGEASGGSAAGSNGTATGAASVRRNGRAARRGTARV